MAEGRNEAELSAEGQKLIDQVAAMKVRTKDLDAEFKQLSDALAAALLTVAQPADPDVPLGKDESENLELRRVGQPPQFDFEPKDHVVLDDALGMLDLERGVKLAGTRNYLLKGDGALCTRPSSAWPLDLMIERGFTQ